MSSGDIIGIVVISVLVPAIVGYLVWLLRLRPRRIAREHRARLDEIGRSLGLPEVEPGLARGVRDGLAVEVSFSVTSTPVRGGRPVTRCRAWLAEPLPVAFAVATPRGSAGATKCWARDVWIGGPNDQALELAASVAPLVEEHARTAEGILSLELDRASCNVTLDGIVVESSRLDRALATAVGLAKALPR